MAVGAGGDLLVADTGNNRIRRIDAAGTITTLAGSGALGFGGDGGPATEAALMWPRCVAGDAAGNVYVADIRHFRIRRIDSRGIIRTVAGTGEPGYSGDGGPAGEARLGWLGGLAVDVAGNLFAADRGNLCVRRIDTAGVIRTVAGTPRGILSPSGVVVGEAMLSAPEGLAIDLAGNLYLADRSAHGIRRVTPDGTVTTVAGMGTAGYAGDGGPASEALLRRPCDVASDLAGNLYIADSRNNRIRKVDPSGRIATAAGSGRWGHGMDDDPAPDTLLDTPERVMARLDGHFYLSGNASGLDTANSRVYEVDPRGLTGCISTVARPGDSRYWPGREPVPDTSLDPDRLSHELAAGHCTAEWYRDLVRRLDADGLVKTVAVGPAGSVGKASPLPSRRRSLPATSRGTAREPSTWRTATAGGCCTCTAMARSLRSPGSSAGMSPARLAGTSRPGSTMPPESRSMRTEMRTSWPRGGSGSWMPPERSHRSREPGGRLLGGWRAGHGRRSRRRGRTGG